MKDKISVILVNYNGITFNDQCIESILKSTLSSRIEIVVVDNASTDGSLEKLHEHWDANQQIHIIELNDNYGFSKANNAGIQWSIQHGISYFVLLNNDTEIESDMIQRMMECSEKKDMIIVPKILYADRPDTIWCAGGYFSFALNKPVQRGMNQKDVGQYDKTELCTFANGCCMLLTSAIIEKIGLLDERFFLYYEDTEYSYRAIKNKIDICYCGSAVVYHKVNGATKGNENPLCAYYISRNWLICQKMHMPKIQFGFFFVYFCMNRFAWLIIWIFQRKKEAIIEMLQGIKDFATGKTGRRMKNVDGLH